MRLKVSSAKRRPFCLGLNVLMSLYGSKWHIDKNPWHLPSHSLNHLDCVCLQNIKQNMLWHFPEFFFLLQLAFYFPLMLHDFLPIKYPNIIIYLIHCIFIQCFCFFSILIFHILQLAWSWLHILGSALVQIFGAKPLFKPMLRYCQLDP